MATKFVKLRYKVQSNLLLSEISWNDKYSICFSVTWITPMICNISTFREKKTLTGIYLKVILKYHIVQLIFTNGLWMNINILVNDDWNDIMRNASRCFILKKDASSEFRNLKMATIQNDYNKTWSMVLCNIHWHTWANMRLNSKIPQKCGKICICFKKYIEFLFVLRVLFGWIWHFIFSNIWGTSNKYWKPFNHIPELWGSVIHFSFIFKPM